MSEKKTSKKADVISEEGKAQPTLLSEIIPKEHLDEMGIARSDVTLIDDYLKTYWEDLPSEKTPINAESLNKIDSKISEMIPLINMFYRNYLSSTERLDGHFAMALQSIQDVYDQTFKPVDDDAPDGSMLVKEGGVWKAYTISEIKDLLSIN